MDFGKWIEATGSKPGDVAKACGVVVQTVYRWRDRLRVPHPRHMRSLMAFTRGQVTPLDFVDFGEKDEKADPDPTPSEVA